MASELHHVSLRITGSMIEYLPLYCDIISIYLYILFLLPIFIIPSREASFMSEASHREHIHNVMLNATFYVGISKLMAKLECSKSAAVLYALNEGLFKEGVISQADHDLLTKRYGRTLKEVIAETQIMKEPSHVPVLTIEQRKEEEFLERKDKQFKGMLEQWKIHTDLNWRIKAVSDAQKFRDKLQSARDLIVQSETKMETAI